MLEPNELNWSAFPAPLKIRSRTVLRSSWTLNRVVSRRISARLDIESSSRRSLSIASAKGISSEDNECRWRVSLKRCSNASSLASTKTPASTSRLRRDSSVAGSSAIDSSDYGRRCPQQHAETGAVDVQRGRQQSSIAIQPANVDTVIAGVFQRVQRIDFPPPDNPEIITKRFAPLTASLLLG